MGRLHTSKPLWKKLCDSMDNDLVFILWQYLSPPFMEDHLTVKITYIVTKIKLMCPAAVSLTIMSVLKNSDLKDKEL